MDMIVDDQRSLFSDIICRTSQAAEAVLLHCAEEINVLYLDHDLGPISNKNGYQLLVWILEDLQAHIPEIILVTANPVGRDNMKAALLNFGYVEVKPTYFQYAPR